MSEGSGSRQAQHAELRFEATRQRTALLLGLTGGEAVVAWADECLLADPAPHPALFDVSLTAPSDLSALRIALAPLADEPVPVEVVDAMLVRTAADLLDGRRSVADSMNILRQMRQMLPLSPALDGELDALVDAHMLAVVGIGETVDAVETRVVDWMRSRVR